MRVALLVLLLLLAVAARAQEDEPPALGPGIPERIQELEKEWADDVGTDPSEDPKAEPDDAAAEAADADHDDEHETTAKPKPAEQVVPKASKPGPLTRPSRDDGAAKRDAARSTTGPAAGPSPKAADSAPARATGED